MPNWQAHSDPSRALAIPKKRMFVVPALAGVLRMFVVPALAGVLRMFVVPALAGGLRMFVVPASAGGLHQQPRHPKGCTTNVSIISGTSALRHSDTSHAAGVSLLEIVAALFVFSVGLLGSLKMYDVMLDKVRAMRENDIAVCALQNEMETLRAMPFEALAERTGAPFVSHTPDMEQLVQVLPTVDVRPYGQPALALKEVRISVRWRGDNGRVIEKTLSTLIGRKEAGPS